MKVSQAVDQINRTIFKPGWKYTAHPYIGDVVYVELLIDTVDTSYPSDDGEYRVPILIGPDTLINVRDMDEMDLAYRLLRFGIEADEHEAREFFKIRQPDGSWHAPFHPHTTAGNRAWARGRTA